VVGYSANNKAQLRPRLRRAQEEGSNTARVFPNNVAFGGDPTLLSPFSQAPESNFEPDHGHKRQTTANPVRSEDSVLSFGFRAAGGFGEGFEAPFRDARTVRGRLNSRLDHANTAEVRFPRPEWVVAT
jgi:hypothetical protein